ncbi:MAG: tetratricopeptide repeat protein [Methanothrix sp.]|uniref:TPR Domain containing protein n=1 Tax=Methanothrix harundinacea TaxID=301375 RepID=A0A101FVH6_9EURY|nr:MAG: hypothetical protein APR56_08185 [Methanosaeta sp. SDB]KUK45260.1 MAG: TPR Domain containing protein [Methanothrix harundinacea]MDD3708739.1 tetratricopeptide repeat protein [Methanothrix sp.]MDI9399728.1 tetratricopeptide repeat protein [Euryarchaeota archaeon]KUK97645.1 MAG: TPR Domain containing protein [Methanothrix harundinacea]
MNDAAIINEYCSAFKAINQNNWYKAALILEKVAKKDEYLNARRYLGIVYLELEELEKAIIELSNVAKAKDKNFRDLSECPETFDEEKGEVNGNLAWAYHDLGMAFLGLEDYDKAELYLKESFKYKKINWVRNDLGWVYYKWDKPDKATKLYEESIREGDDSGHVHFYLGLALIKTGELERAREELEESIKKFDEPANISHNLMKASSLNNLGRIEMDVGDYKKAKSLFLEGLEICEMKECQEQIKTFSPRAKRKEKKTIAALHNNLGRLYFNQGFFDEAKKEYKSAIKSEELPETYNNLAAVYNKEGAKDKAEIFLKNALRLDPNMKVAKANLDRLAGGGGGGTSWWEWWFKPGSSDSIKWIEMLRHTVGLVLVVSLLVMIGNLVVTSFAGLGVSVSGLGQFSLNDTDVTEITEDTLKNVTNGTSEITITNVTKTTTTENRPGLVNKMLITVLIFFLLVHPRVKVFSLGEAKLEMETASVSGSPSFHCESSISS